MTRVTDDGALAGEFPAWRIWRARGGLRMATRRYRLTDAQLDAGLHMTLCEDGAEQLRAELARQRVRESRTGTAAR